MLRHRLRQLRSVPTSRQDLLMGTVVSQRLYGIHASGVAEEAAREIARLEHLLSAHDSNSEISAIGTLAGVQSCRVHTDTFTVLSLGKHLHTLSRGAFDVTCGPLCTLWQRALGQGRTPDHHELEAATKLVDDSALVVQLGLDDAPRAFLTKPGQHIDLGGIGKGYAADCCRALYARRGVRHGIVDLGGSVTVFGGKPDGSPFRVGIQRPDAARGDWLGYLEMRDGAVVTSGSYERFGALDGKRFSHILDPRTGCPVQSDVASATIVSYSATRADALATASVVLGVEGALALIENLPNAEAIVVDESGAVHPTSGLRGRFVTRPES